MSTPYHRVWRKANGYGPWPCFGCGQEVAELGSLSEGPWRDQGVIHHHDGNHGNNALGNLRVMHHGCHGRHHNTHSVKPIHVRVDLTIAQGPYRQIADQLRAMIASGEITGQLPTLLDLMNMINPRPGYNTVRKAVEVLKKEGLVTTAPGRGTFVKREG